MKYKFEDWQRKVNDGSEALELVYEELLRLEKNLSDNSNEDWLHKGFGILHKINNSS